MIWVRRSAGMLFSVAMYSMTFCFTMSMPEASTAVLTLLGIKP